MMPMQAAVFHGDRRISIETAPRPVAAAGEALLRVRRTALCGSDGKLWLKGAAVTAGHEIFGVVEHAGHPLDGRRCLVYIPVHCGACASCARGDTHLCLTESTLVGWNRAGGYAEYVSVPEQCLLPVPDDIDDVEAPLLLDTVSTSAHGIRLARAVVPANGDPAVLVIGAGPIGLGAIIALQAEGYRDLAIADLREQRLAHAAALGASAHPVGSMDRRFDLIVEASGAHAARNFGMANVQPRGVLLLLGENDAPWTIEETKPVRRKDFWMLRSFYFPKREFAANVELLRANRARYRGFVDAEFPLAELPHEFARFMAGERVKPQMVC
jgi:propanol-preferring alcohol dehydrogenase